MASSLMEVHAPNPNVYIGNLPPDIDQDKFVGIFQHYGTIKSCKVMPPKQVGMKASALVEFKSIEDAQWIVQTCNGNVIQGLPDPIKCNFGPDRTSKPNLNQGGPYGGPFGCGSLGKGGGGGGSGPTVVPPPLGSAWPAGGNAAAGLLETIKATGMLGGGKAPLENQVCVKCLPPDADELFLFQLFSPFGGICVNGLKVMKTPEGACNGMAFVDFSDKDAAAGACIALNGYETLGGALSCARKSDPNGAQIQSSLPPSMQPQRQLQQDCPPDMQKTLGQVKAFNPQRGFGFIMGDDNSGGADVFIPGQNLQPGYMPTPGDYVMYVLQHQKDGKPVARWVTKVDPSQFQPA